MAKNKEEAAAAKAKKQKIILIVGAVLLLGLGAIQGPKLMKGGAQSDAAPVEDASAVTETEGSVSTAPAPVPTSTPPVSGGKPAGSVSGVALPGPARVRPADHQLASFVMFDDKDPFVQGVSTDDGSAAAAGDNGTAATGAVPGVTNAPASPSPTVTGGPAPADAPKMPIAFATINFDGKPQQVTLKKGFPEDEPVFVVRGMTKNTVKIGVAGGSFDDGQTITLNRGKKVTLVNTATGVRYELKVVFTGTAPETIKGFTTGQEGGVSATNATDGSSTTPPVTVAP